MVDATCMGGVVTADGVPVPAVEILSKGVGASTGLLLGDKEKWKYLPSNATDIESAITKINSALTEIANALTAIGAGMTGPTTAPPPTLAASVTAINAQITLLNTLKGALK